MCKTAGLRVRVRVRVKVRVKVRVRGRDLLQFVGCSRYRSCKDKTI
jgi:hypothetical protein